MSIHPYPYDLPLVAEMNEAQMDGRECVYCPGGCRSAHEGAMKPVGRLLGTLVFAHIECAEAHKWEEL